MNRLLASFCGLLLATLLAVSPLRGQGSSSSSRPGSTGSTTSRPTTPQRPRQPTEQMRRPIYVNGRIVLGDTGKPVPESVSVELNCGMKALQVIRTDLSGYFTFTLGGAAGSYSNMDFSASNENPLSFGGSRSNLPRRFGNSLAGCELRLSVPGYHPLSYTLTQNTDMGRVEVGTLRLRRIAGVEGSAISLTSLLVPKKARKEFEKGMKEMRKNRPEKARKYFEKAVAEYDQYAAAWNELGRVHLAAKETDQAAEAFEKAIAVDPHYVPPFVNLATLQLQNRDYQNAVETAGKVLDLDRSIGFASFIQAVGNFNLENLEAAEKSAREAEKGPHQNIPQLHALLAEIFLQRESYTNAAVEMRTYLEESPEGRFAERMKEALEQIEQFQGGQASESSPQADPGL